MSGGKDGGDAERAVRLQLVTGRMFQRLRTEAGGVSGISLAQEWIIHLLQGTPAGLSGAELAREQGVTAQTMSAAVAALQRRGLVRGEADPADRRRTVLFATEAGVTALRRSREAKSRWLADALAELTDAELHALDEGMGLLERLLGAGPGSSVGNATGGTAAAAAAEAKR